MATITKPFTFAAGAIVVASEHNSNFDTIYSDYNGGITNANLSASAAVALSKLATLTASKALASDASGFIVVTSVTSTELGYLSGVTSAIQTQIDAKQSTDAELTAIAGLTSAADKGIMFTGSGTAAVYTLTAAGLALLDDAAASNQRTTLGLGTIATQDSNNVSITGGSVTGITDVAIADGGTGASTAANAFAALKQDATSSATGVSELAIVSELETGTDAARVITPDVFAGSNQGERILQATVIGYTTATATGDGKFYFIIPSSMNGMDLVEVNARVITAGTTNTTDIQIANVTQAADMLSTKMTIDSAETSTSTAATPAVIDTGNDDVATNDLIRVDIDAVSTTPAQGLIVTLIFRLP